MASKPIFVGTTEYGSKGHEVAIVNPPNAHGDASYNESRFILWFAPSIYTMVWADSLEDALEIGAAWCKDNAPGVFCDEEVNSAYHEAITEWEVENGSLPQATPEDQLFLFSAERRAEVYAIERKRERAEEYAREIAEVDTTYTESGFIPCDSWGIALDESATRDDVIEFITGERPEQKPLAIQLAKKALGAKKGDLRRVA